MKTKEQFYNKWPKLFTDVKCGFYLPNGWSTLVWDMCVSLDLELDGDFSKLSCVQVKEKFGGLRFYTHDQTNNDKVNEIINAACNLSCETCQNCGTVEGVECKGPRWLTTQCEPCRDAYEIARTKRMDKLDG